MPAQSIHRKLSFYPIPFLLVLSHREIQVFPLKNTQSTRYLFKKVLEKIGEEKFAQRRITEKGKIIISALLIFALTSPA